jgi:hypothetical protein
MGAFFNEIIIEIIIKFLLTRGVYREISDRGLFCTDQARRARFVPKDRGPIFRCTFRASKVNKKFTGIYT